MIRIGIIIGSTRPERRGDRVAEWVHETATRRGGAEFDLIDLRDHPLPHLDEPLGAVHRQYRNEHTKRWSAVISAYDGFVIVTPEYNHGMPEFENYTVPKPSERSIAALDAMLDQLIAWNTALAPLRATAVAAR
jgi:hypothetical protein